MEIEEKLTPLVSGDFPEEETKVPEEEEVESENSPEDEGEEDKEEEW